MLFRSIVLHEETDVLLSSYAVLKMDAGQYEQLDQKYILRTKQEAFGVSCLTNQKYFYMENYPGLVVEQGGIDDLILYITPTGIQMKVKIFGEDLDINKD